MEDRRGEKGRQVMLIPMSLLWTETPLEGGVSSGGTLTWEPSTLVSHPSPSGLSL